MVCNTSSGMHLDMHKHIDSSTVLHSYLTCIYHLVYATLDWGPLSHQIMYGELLSIVVWVVNKSLPSAAESCMVLSAQIKCGDSTLSA